jgi:hypothetical protein
VTKNKIIDYTKMELGRVTRTYQGRNVSVIARCPKCGKKGERSVSFPEPKEGLRRRPAYVSVHHLMEIKSWGKDVARAGGFFGSQYGYVKESCSVTVDRSNVEDLLSVAERKRYDALVAELRAWVETF